MWELDEWIAGRATDGFPYDAVIEEYHRVGKHFVPAEVLAELDRARESVRLLARFLDTALDKWDGRYDYRTYLALDLLPMPGTGDSGQDPAAAQRRHDRLVVQLVADAVRFELDVLDERTQRFPRQRPDSATVAKRLRLALRAVEPQNRRTGLPTLASDADASAAARTFCELVEKDRTPAEKRALELSDLPVHVVHDEYLFIRVLQSFESTFAVLAVCLRTAIADISGGRIDVAADRLRAARTTLAEAARLFSLLATVQVESFRTFRTYTEGASAIQSHNYKIVESLCRTPDPSRLHSPAYQWVPGIRETVLGGQHTLDAAVRDAAAGDRADQAGLADLREAMRAFAATLVQWRQTHYRLALRMLGQRSGTGYTEGTPYLDQARTIPVFRAVDGDESEVTGA